MCKRIFLIIAISCLLIGCYPLIGSPGVTTLTLKVNDDIYSVPIGLIAKIANNSSIREANASFEIEPGTYTLGWVLYWTEWVTTHYHTNFNNNSGVYVYSSDYSGDEQVTFYKNKYTNFTDSLYYNQYNLIIRANNKGTFPFKAGLDRDVTITFNWDKTGVLSSMAGPTITIIDTLSNKTIQKISTDDGTSISLEYLSPGH